MSAAVDDVIQRSGRPDRRWDIVSWVRSTIREMQVQALFTRDFYEAQLNTAVDPFTWPRPQNFRQMQTVEYAALVDPQGQTIKPRFATPNRLRRPRYWYYETESTFVFSGHLQNDTSQSATTPINVGYYGYAPKLNYWQSVDERPARYDLVEGIWVYNDQYDDTDEEKETARALVSNWILFDWYDAVLEGALAKVFNSTNDERRQSTFASFQNMKRDMMKGERRSVVGGDP